MSTALENFSEELQEEKEIIDSIYNFESKDAKWTIQDENCVTLVVKVSLEEGTISENFELTFIFSKEYPKTLPILKSFRCVLNVEDIPRKEYEKIQEKLEMQLKEWKGDEDGVVLKSINFIKEKLNEYIFENKNGDDYDEKRKKRIKYLKEKLKKTSKEEKLFGLEKEDFESPELKKISGDVFKEEKKKKKEEKKKDESEDDDEKEKLKMSYDTMMRIKYDNHYPNDQFSVVYLDRFIGLEEINFEDFLVGEVPYHRIYYIKLNGNVVWDRKERKDLLADGTAIKFVKKDEKEEEKEKKEILEKEKEKEEVIQVMFSNKKNRKVYQDYIPEDTLEGWMLKNNDRDVCLESPTHISQKGGYYCIKMNDIPVLHEKWSESVGKREKFYMEEVRTPIFRLYLDFDIKTTNKTRFSDFESLWIPEIQKITKMFFSKELEKKGSKDINLKFDVCVLDSHGEWKDAVCEDANFKSGFRLYYTYIYVDKEIQTELTKVLGEELSKKFSKTENFPKNWKFTDIVDLEQCHHEKSRMVGSTKYRRGRDLGRVYKLMGYYNDEGKKNDVFEKKINDLNLCYLTSCRYYSNDDLSFFTKKDFERLKVVKFTEKSIKMGKAILRK